MPVVEYSPAVIAAGAAGILAGHWITSAKIVIPLGGKTAKEKSEALRAKIRKPY